MVARKENCSSEPPVLAIRGDASPAIGTGHIMRMIALAQAWQDEGGKVCFLSAQITSSLEERLKQEGFGLEKFFAEPGSQSDLNATCAAISHLAAGGWVFVALDGYRFDASFQLELKKSGCRLLVLDDYGHASFYHSDWVLNQNAAASHNLYRRRAAYTKLLLGTRFALLRREFVKYRNWKRQTAEVARNVLLTLGGADPDNVTSDAIRALAGLDIHLKVVVGGTNPHLSRLRHLLNASTENKAIVELIINPESMPDLMIWADLAVTAGGSTVWEIAFLGLPSVCLVLADNQLANGQAVQSLGCGLTLRKSPQMAIPSNLETAVKDLLANYRMRCEFSLRCCESIDGLGAVRAAKILQER